MRTINVLGIDYTVELVSPNMGRGTDAGNVDNGRCSIRIDADSNHPDHARSVILHEIIEALNYRLELNLEHPTITQLETGLFAVIQSNPEWFRFVMPPTPPSDLTLNEKTPPREAG